MAGIFIQNKEKTKININKKKETDGWVKEIICKSCTFGNYHYVKNKNVIHHVNTHYNHLFSLTRHKKVVPVQHTETVRMFG